MTKTGLAKSIGACAMVLFVSSAPAAAQMWEEIPGGNRYEAVCGRCHFWPGRFTEYVFLPGRRAALYNFMDRHHAEDPVLRLTVMEFIRTFSRKHGLVPEDQ